MFKKNLQKIITEYFIIGLGAFILAVGLHFFLFSNNIASGGVTGLALILNHIFHIPSSIIVTIANIILFSLAFIIVSGEFGAKSIYASIMLSLSLSIFEIFFSKANATDDLILATIFGAFVVSIGTTMIYMYEASTGGTAILAKFLNKFFKIRIGMSSFIVDAVVAILAIFAFNINLALYGILSVYICGFLIDKFIDGFNSYKQVMIITSKKDIVLDFILKDFDRGCTILNATGGFSKTDKNVLLTVISRKQYIHLRKFLKETDPTAFVTVNDVIKVFGEGFEVLE